MRAGEGLPVCLMTSDLKGTSITFHYVKCEVTATVELVSLKSFSIVDIRIRSSMIDNWV